MSDVSIIIVSWNTSRLLESCLRSLNSRDSGIALEVIVVDNGSDDDSVAMVRRRFPEVQLIANGKNVGFAQANNQGIVRSSGRHVMLLNSDTEVQPGAIETLVGFLETHQEVAAVGPYLLNTDGSLQPSCHPILTPEREFWRLAFLDELVPVATYPMGRWDASTPRQVEVIKGACLVMRRAVLDQIGLLDERYFIYSEEMDLCLRIARAGWQLYWVPSARVVHHGAASTKQVAESMYLQLYRSKLQFQEKHFGRWGALRFKVLVELAFLPRWLVASIGSPLDRSMVSRARIYGQLLSTLPSM
jgi:N-acetylglucosaminyl-diphospho-decaprenol L-rhamnosyltransferase